MEKNEGEGEKELLYFQDSSFIALSSSIPPPPPPQSSDSSINGKNQKTLQSVCEEKVEEPNDYQEVTPGMLSDLAR